jgi:hypothetical protein
MSASRSISLVRGPAKKQSAADLFRSNFVRNLTTLLDDRQVVPSEEVGKINALAAMRSLPDALDLLKLGKLLELPVDALVNPSAKRGLDVGSAHPDLIDDSYHCITLHDTSSEDGFAIYMLPETLRHMKLPRRTMMLTVTNEDMAPTFRPGDIAIYDPRVTSITTNGVYVLLTAGQFIVRRVQKKGLELTLAGENSSVEPIELSAKDLAGQSRDDAKHQVVGRVIGKVSVGNV